MLRLIYAIWIEVMLCKQGLFSYVIVFLINPMFAMTKWSTDVQGRLQDCVGFVAAEAVYHLQYHSRFYNTACNIGPSVPGRPVNLSIAENFDKLCIWLENECDRSNNVR